MELDDLRVFAEIARGATLARAAERLHLTVSALSKSIRRLESALDTPLFDRVGARLRLNEAGRRLLPRAIDLLDRAKSARAAVAAAGAVRIEVAGPALLQWKWAGHLHARIRERIPAAEVGFVARYEDDAVADLAAGTCDVALVTREAVSDGMPPDWHVEPLGRFRTVLASGPSGRTPPVVACSTFSPLCGLPKHAQSAEWHERAEVGRPTLRVDDVLVLVRLVQEGLATAFLPDFLADAFGLQVDTRPPFEQADEDVILLTRDGLVDML
jgi:DNA-binding transcriptional LysR family regulator